MASTGATNGRDNGNASCDNLLLRSLSNADYSLIAQHLVSIQVERGTTIFQAGDDVTHVVFPCDGTVISLVIIFPDGGSVEAAVIGREGAAGGVISHGHKPAFTHAIVQISGRAIRLSSESLEKARNISHSFQKAMAAYSDCLLAQVLQSVACNAVHNILERCCRWLLIAQDRFGFDEVPLTQELLAEMLGVQRTTVTEVMRSLQERQVLSYHRGRITILDRPALEALTCPCYASVRDHFERVMPVLYPSRLL